MPCVLLTLASEEARGEAFLPGRPAPGNFRPVFSTARNTENKLLTLAVVNQSFFFLNGGEKACAQRANYTMYHIQYLFIFWLKSWLLL